MLYTAIIQNVSNVLHVTLSNSETINLLDT